MLLSFCVFFIVKHRLEVVHLCRQNMLSKNRYFYYNFSSIIYKTNYWKSLLINFVLNPPKGSGHSHHRNRHDTPRTSPFSSWLLPSVWCRRPSSWTASFVGQRHRRCSERYSRYSTILGGKQSPWRAFYAKRASLLFDRRFLPHDMRQVSLRPARQLSLPVR